MKQKGVFFSILLNLVLVLAPPSYLKHAHADKGQRFFLNPLYYGSMLII